MRRRTWAIAAGLAVWMLVGHVLALAHQAGNAHATLTDGTVVHVEGAPLADAHAACQEHSRTSTVDRHTPPVAPADPCWVGDVAQPGITAHPRFDQLILAIARAAIAAAPVHAPAAIAVLDLAPKTSPPA
jgi:hypothetical protein